MVLAILVGVLSMAACDKCGGDTGTPQGPAATPPAGASELSVLIFPNYLDDKSLKDFEEQNKTRVRLTIYDSTEEMESKLAYAGADAQYDVVVMASHAMPRLARRGLVRPLDHAQIPNIKNLEARFSGPNFDDGNKHSIPYQWGTVAIIYNKQKIPNMEPTWGMLLDPQKVPGTFVLIDEMRDMIGATLKYKGYSSNTTNPDEIREAGRILQEAKKHPKCLGFKGGIGATQDVKGGSVDMAVVWNGDAQKVVWEDKDRLALIIPKEGSVIWVDVMTVPTKAPHPELAYKFINHMLTPDAGVQLSLMTKYATPNAAAQAKLPVEDRTNQLIYPTGDLASRLEHHRDLGEAAKLYDDVWTTVKSN
ncbi:polyamine ABC transporter substrate-binding protein [Sorangium sp. So ce131]|uniref:polyamine ABC transporter substrate-binding protein n=1 Tax=Sorangium sp. So ce131 TaxID=3133282 RepID=UPI003F642705